jgi:hypothetical protein
MLPSLREEVESLVFFLTDEYPLGMREETQLWHIVPLPSLGRDFTSAPMSAAIGPDPNVTDVRWDGKNWIVSLQGRWTEQITLDTNYNVVSMQKVE